MTETRSHLAPTLEAILSMGIDLVPTGTLATIIGIDDEEARRTLIRLGFEEGALVEVVSRIPFGPVILQRRQRQVAIGRDLARCVRVAVQ